MWLMCKNKVKRNGNKSQWGGCRKKLRLGVVYFPAKPCWAKPGLGDEASLHLEIKFQISLGNCVSTVGYISFPNIYLSPGTWSDQSLGGGWSCREPEGWSRGREGPWHTLGCPRSCRSCRRSHGKASPSWSRPARRERSMSKSCNS